MTGGASAGGPRRRGGSIRDAASSPRRPAASVASSRPRAAAGQASRRPAYPALDRRRRALVPVALLGLVAVGALVASLALFGGRTGGGGSGAPGAGSAAPPAAPTLPAASVTNDDGLRLTIAADRLSYAVSDAIDVSASLTYLGPDESLPLAHGGGTSGIVGFGVRQLDGPLAIDPAVPARCVSGDELTRDNPRSLPFTTSAGAPGAGGSAGQSAIAASTDAAASAARETSPQAAFAGRFHADPQLHLPAGRWEIFAVASYAVGDCAGRPGSIRAAVQITVGAPGA